MCLIKNCISFAKNSSIHGIKYTVDSTTSILERICWALTIALSLALSIYLTTLFWEKFTSNPTRTLLDTTAAPTNTVPFPGVTICNINKMLQHKVDNFLGKLDAEVDEWLVTKNVISKMMVTEIVTENSESKYNVTELAIAEDVLEKNGYEDIKRMLVRISQSCDDMIVKCAWNKREVRCTDIFEETYTIEGRCCSFNYIRRDSFKHTLYNLYYGLSTGLRVILLPDFNNRSLAGVTVTVHNPRDFPGGDYNIKKTLPLGKVNYMQVQGSKRKCSQSVRDLHIIHRQCIYSDERDLDYFNNYTYSNCLSLCEASMVFARCQCVPYYYDFIYEVAECNLQNITCFENFENDMLETCDCPAQCEDEFYEVKMTNTKFTNNSEFWMMEYLKDFNNSENSILLNIFFATNRQTIWLRDTITSATYLIASFGGIYSLFLGCSVITVIEILYYFIGKSFIRCIWPHIEIGERKDRDVAKIFTFQSVGMSSNVNQREYYLNPIEPFIN